jgi:hypothetical protein
MKQLLAMVFAALFAMTVNAQTEEKKEGKDVAAEKKEDKGKDGKAVSEEKKKGAHADTKKKSEEPAPVPAK